MMINSGENLDVSFIEGIAVFGTSSDKSLWINIAACTLETKLNILMTVGHTIHAADAQFVLYHKAKEFMNTDEINTFEILAKKLFPPLS